MVIYVLFTQNLSLDKGLSCFTTVLNLFYSFKKLRDQTEAKVEDSRYLLIDLILAKYLIFIQNGVQCQTADFLNSFFVLFYQIPC